MINAKTDGPKHANLGDSGGDTPVDHLNGRSRKRGMIRQSVVPPVIFGVAVGLAWELLHRSGLVSPVIIPSPFSVGLAFIRQASSPEMWSELWVTVQESLYGFFIGASTGLALGIAIGLSTTVSRAIYPYMVLLQSMPRVAFAPVFLAIFGFGMGPKIATSVAICFFPPLLNTIVGLRQVDQTMISLFRSYCATKGQMFRKLLLPSALPMIMGGLKTAMTFAFIGAIVGELQAANAGIGKLMEAAAFRLDIASLFGYIIWISLVALAVFGIMEVIERRLVFWKRDLFQELQEGLN